jgi:hypothetical protein
MSPGNVPDPYGIRVDNNIPKPAKARLTLAGCLVLLHLRCSTPRQL